VTLIPTIEEPSPLRVVFGDGIIHEIGLVLEQLGVRSLFLVTGASSFERSGAAAAVESALTRVAVTRFAGVLPNPTAERLAEAIEVLRSRPCDAVVGVGGGSVLDVAKAAAALAPHPGEVVEYVVGKRRLTGPRSPRLVLIPTTAGSGSEATRFATVYASGRKHSLDHASLRCDVALVDPLLTYSQPRHVAASAGLDAFCHAVESSWSRRSSGRSRLLARRALQLLTGRLLVSCNEGVPAARRSIALAAHLAGRAIDISRTTTAHAMAYPLTSYHGVDHGHACALNLSWLLAHNGAITPGDVSDPRGWSFARARIGEVLSMLGVAHGEDGRAYVLRLIGELGLSPCLQALGICEADLDRIVSDAMSSERTANNPRRLGRDVAFQGLRSLLGNAA
jgi:alcohol dehydrogenase class IV